MAAIPNSTDQASCCSSFYEQDWVRVLAEDVFHPGGAELSRRTVAGMNLGQGASLLDLGCGVGNTARIVGLERQLAVTGIDFSRTNLKRAMGSGEPRARFVQADAHQLPFVDASFDGVISECVLSLLADKPAALGEIRRILKPGGQLGVTDMSVQGVLPADFAAAVTPWSCLAGALDQDSYISHFESEGFRVVVAADESNSLTDLIGILKRKLILVGAGSLAAGRPGLDLDTIRFWLGRFASEVDNGVIKYLRFQLEVLPERARPEPVLTG